jgi:hypothetical protein
VASNSTICKLNKEYTSNLRTLEALLITSCKKVKTKRLLKAVTCFLLIPNSLNLGRFKGVTMESAFNVSNFLRKALRILNHVTFLLLLLFRNRALQYVM